jgi:RNA polymerase sigma factor (TIGR02999 family)
MNPSPEQPVAGTPAGIEPHAGQPAAGAFERIYAELHRLAASFFRHERGNHTLQPTALVHEAFLRLAESSAEWTDPVRFRALAAKVMRHVLVDHALARKAVKRGGGRALLPLDVDAVFTATPDLDVEELDRALQRLAANDERKARVVELRFFGGLTAAETAAEMSISVTTVESDWRMAKAWLRSELSRE